ncbi:hypothetical protein [Pseudomonas syringae group genomosp. 3]|uniref:hypothetical protein n=1 Tax=Pseudomonas syringae group genomosp. 3 TaxID=251701 RepID=UPI000EFF5C51|nr:hypothetical protein [Pseudomonas syringae group genomosp. 3]
MNERIIISYIIIILLRPLHLFIVMYDIYRRKKTGGTMNIRANKIVIEDAAVKVVFETLKEIHRNKLTLEVDSVLVKVSQLASKAQEKSPTSKLGYIMFYLDYIYSNASITLLNDSQKFMLTIDGSTNYLEADDLVDKLSLFSVKLFHKCKEEGNKYTDRVLNTL